LRRFAADWGLNPTAKLKNLSSHARTEALRHPKSVGIKTKVEIKAKEDQGQRRSRSKKIRVKEDQSQRQTDKSVRPHGECYSTTTV
jgi:hypothetical protein